MAPSKSKTPKGGASKSRSGAIISDPRFANIHSDPRFRLPSKKSTHVTVDKRFAHMLQDDDFTRKASVDRYGRKITKDAGKKELERMYRVEGEDEDEDGEAEEQNSDEVDDDDEVQKELARVERKYDPAREGGFSSSEDESDEDDEDEVEVQEEDAFDFPTGGKEAEIEEMEDATPRLAVVNLDWDNIRAADLMAVANSFAPEGGRILNVTVYPSEFGRERMEREELEGPPREIFAKNKKDDSEASGSEEDSDDEEEKIKNELLQEDKGDEFDSKALRQYQLERLRYYYAVITADSAGTARQIYDNMDGREYLSSANFFDLRFVPDDVSFDEDKPRDECKRIPDGYRPNDFVTDALTHSRVKLTWDADDNSRKEIQKRAFSQQEIDDNDLAAYIGSDSSSDEDAGSEGDSEAEAAAAAGTGTTNRDAKKRAREEKAAKLRAALGLDAGSAPAGTKKARDADKKPVGDMQITFTSGLSSGKADKKAVFENQPEESTKEKYVRKERERKQRRKDRAKARSMGLDPDDPEALAKVRGDDADADADGADSSEEKVADDDDAAAADPFNDPFFENPDQERKRAFKEAKKADKQRKREEREAQAAKSAAERAQLELLMAEDEGRSHLRHFDINEIEKGEKQKGKKKGKWAKKAAAKKGDEAAENAPPEQDQEGFQMDTQDPRFKALFESHEFAIDPTNPRFRGTKGMKALLEEGRKKRKMGRGEEEEAAAAEVSNSRGKRAKKGEGAGGEGGRQQDDLKRLVERVKGKTKKSKA
ncbi:pre-rrna-processing protein esf1 [Diplodia corticola]|uniref:Pre-rrna-processing protein esf1 n=1 Tax=Diplodia corticola TaxID=236234 RepID=A0A1J9S7Q2_9PEZI|nr:pre-rrna-processing protein esf1 [Diplodia corticola]OJD36519.1 pre-rrna-processing protein esf1 [Diplodia corticola]